MKKDLHRATVSLLTLLSMVVLFGCFSSQFGDNSASAKQTKRIIFLTNGDASFWDPARTGLHKAAEDLDLEAAGYQAVQHRGDFTAQTQIDRLNQYATETDVVAVAVSITEPDNKQLVSALRRLQERGICVIAVDSDVNRDEHRSARFAFLGTNNVIAGRELGKAAAALRPDGGRYATFVGNKEQGNSIERINGFAAGAGESFESLGSYADGGDDQVAQDRVRTALDSFPELNTLVGIWAYNAHAIVKLVNERGRRDTSTIVVFDAQKNALGDMEDGFIDAMIVQNPYQMGYLSVQLLKAMLDDDGEAIRNVLPDYNPATSQFNAPDGDIFTTELRMVVPNESSVLTPDLFDKETIFFYLKDFRKWLADRGLEDS